MRIILSAAMLGLVIAAMSTTGSGVLLAAHKADPACSISPNPAALGATYVVAARGLPALSPINLIVSSAGGTTISPLGSTPDGTFALNESSAVAGTTTYQFAGLIRKNTQIYATCSVAAY